MDTSSDDTRTYFALQFDQNEVYIGSTDLDSFVHTTDGRIVELDFSGNLVSDVGTFSVIQVDVENAIAARVSVFEIFDITQTTMDYYEGLYETSWEFKPALHGVLGRRAYIDCLNLLIIDRLLVLPAHRGKQVGLRSMATIIERFRIGAGLVAIKPFPLQHEGRYLDGGSPEEFEQLGFSAFRETFRSATAKLRRHYAKLGFKKVPRSAFMIRVPIKTFSDS